MSRPRSKDGGEASSGRFPLLLVFVRNTTDSTKLIVKEFFGDIVNWGESSWSNGKVMQKLCII